jgi:hypothetical protein
MPVDGTGKQQDRAKKKKQFSGPDIDKMVWRRSIWGLIGEKDVAGDY